jgi:hypothetical protein
MVIPFAHFNFLRAVFVGLDGWEKRAYTGRIYKTFDVKVFVNHKKGSGIIVRFKKGERDFRAERVIYWCIGNISDITNKINKTRKGVNI